MSAMGQSRPTHPAPALINVRCYSNSDQKYCGAANDAFVPLATLTRYHAIASPQVDQLEYQLGLALRNIEFASENLLYSVE
jgi:hypothetical protein